MFAELCHVKQVMEFILILMVYSAATHPAFISDLGHELTAYIDIIVL
jgi:hypothetical protein